MLGRTVRDLRKFSDNLDPVQLKPNTNEKTLNCPNLRENIKSQFIINHKTSLLAIRLH